MQTQTQPPPQPQTLQLPNLVAPFSWKPGAHEYKIIALRECPLPEHQKLCDTPDLAAQYWTTHIATHPHYDTERECLAVLLLNTRRYVKGHQLLSHGTRDTILVDPPAVFRLAVTTSASAIILMHNHPSGLCTPSEGDIKVTRDIMRGGQLLKVELLDHIIMGAQGTHQSLRKLGYFAA